MKGCVQELTYPSAWLEYLIHFHTTQDYFECHEVLEEHWKNEGMKGNLWPGLIQIAVALYHQRRGNKNGARRMITSSILKLQTEIDGLRELGIDTEPFFVVLNGRKQEIEKDRPFEPITLPLTPTLLQTCLNEAKVTEDEWFSTDSADENIIHKHAYRDRSSVVDERQRQKLKKNRVF